MSRFVALVCPKCAGAFTTEPRHATVRCPRCAHPFAAAKRFPLWEGDDPAAAGMAMARYRAGRAGAGLGTLRLASPRAHALPHESPVHGAAAAGRAVPNASQRAEAVAAALCGGRACTHGQLVEALEAAGLTPERADREVTRMLACDVLLEPRPGTYRLT